MDAIKEDAVGGVGDNHEQGIMQCSDHPYNRSNPGGICAFCLKEKLGKLVSSPSFPLPVRASSSSSSPSPSFGSNIVVASTTAGVVDVNGGGAVGNNANVGVDASLAVTRKGRMIPFLLAKKKKPTTRKLDHDVVLKRCKSTTTPRRSNFFDFGRNGVVDFSPRTKKGTSFWSFLYMSSSTTTKPTKTTTPTPRRPPPPTTRPTYGPTMKSNDDKSIRDNSIVVVQEGDDHNTTQGNNNETTSSCFERKVSRSRSVGCGSRSFSGDFFERISSGCGDCTSLRRVESQREGSSKTKKVHRGGVNTTNPNMKGRVRCGGIFGGFTINSSSSSSFSSSSSSSSYWVSSSSSSGEEVSNGKSSRGVHSRNRSWGWALASPMRAFGKQSSKDGNNKNTKTIRNSSTDKNTTPNLSAMPSLLTSTS